MLRDAIDFMRRGHIYLQTPSLREEVFDLIQRKLKEYLEAGDLEQTSTWLLILSNILDGVSSEARKDQALVEKARRFFGENREWVKGIAFRARSASSRYYPLYLLIKHLPRGNAFVSTDDQIDVYLLMYHTLRYAEIFGKTSTGEKDLRTLYLSIKGLYRWDGSHLLKGLLTVPELFEFERGLSNGDRDSYPEVIERILKLKNGLFNEKLSPEELLRLLLAKNSFLALRYLLLEEKKKDRPYHFVKANEERIREELKSRLARSFGDESIAILSDEIWLHLIEGLGEELKFVEVRGLDKMVIKGERAFQSFSHASFSSDFDPALLRILKSLSSSSKS